MAKQLPLKLRVFEYISQMDRPLTSKEVYEALKDEYPGERQMSLARIDDYMQELLGVNMIKEGKLQLDEKDELEVQYEITDFGRTRIKYIPRKKEK